MFFFGYVFELCILFLLKLNLDWNNLVGFVYGGFGIRGIKFENI